MFYVRFIKMYLFYQQRYSTKSYYTHQRLDLNFLEWNNEKNNWIETFIYFLYVFIIAQTQF